MIAHMKALLGGAAAADAMVLALAAIQAIPLPSAETFGVAAGTGAATSLAVLWAWKAATDKRLENIENNKASKDDLAPLKEDLRDIKEDVRYLVRNHIAGGTKP